MIRCKSALALAALVVTLFCAHVTGAPGATVTPSLVVSNVPATSDVKDAPKPEKSEARVQEDETFHLKPRISSMHVECNVSSRYATTLVTSKVANPASKANEVTFSMVIPETAFITSFSMEIDGTVYDAYVKEKEEAKKVYQTAVSSGLAAAHVAVQARDSNHFTVSVNVEPRTKAIFRLTYEEFLTRRLGVYNLVTNLNPGQIVEDLSVDVNIAESSPITSLLVPELRTGNEIDAQPTDTPNPFSTQHLSDDKLTAKVHFAPDSTQQLELMQKFKEREAATTAPPRFGFFDSKPEKSDPEGVMGQFVVQYDVNRDVKGEVLVNDGYFVHFFAPGDLKPLSKHVIFVLDVSGSMVGRKINQLKEAMNSILQDLNHGDYFNIIDFSYSANVYNLDDSKKNAQYRSNHYNNFYGDENNQPLTEPEVPPPPKKATPDNIAKAKNIIDQLQAMGGTNIHDALTTAIKIANFGIEAAASSSNKKPKPEPMIIFLTDGDPTVGETDPEKILSAVSKLNNKKTAIFSLAFGEDADRTFLRKVSLQNSGFMRHIYEAADAAQQLRHFYRQVASPLLTNVTYTYPQEQIDEASLTKKDFHYFFLGSELVVAGKLKKEVTGNPFKIVADGFDGPLDYIPLVPLIEKRTKFWPLERVWAYLTIKQLLDDKDSLSNRVEDNLSKEPSKKALELALKYSFVTPLTSLVVVKPNSTSAVDAESIPAGGHGIALPLSSFSSPLLAGGSGYNYALPAAYMPAPTRPISSYHRMSAMVLPPQQPPPPNFGFAGPPSYPSGGNVLSSPMHTYQVPSFSSGPPMSGYYGGSIGMGSSGPISSLSTKSSPAASYSMGMAGMPGLPGMPGMPGLPGISGSYDSYSGSEAVAASLPMRVVHRPMGVSFQESAVAESDDFSVDSDSVPAPLTTTPRPYHHTSVAPPRPTLTTAATTPAQTDEAKVATVTNATVTARLALYGLEAYAWLEPYLDSEEDSFTVPMSATGSKLSYKLKAKKNEYPVSEAKVCANSIGGGSGNCQYLTDCKELHDGFKDLATYLNHFCDSNGFAGVCCKAELP